MDDLTTSASVGPLGPRAVSSPGLIAAVRRAWELGPVTGVTDLGGTYNLNLRLQTDPDAVVLRVYRPWISATRLAATQAARDALAEQGLPVVAPLRSPSGDGATVFDGRLIELDPWRPDDGGTDDQERLHAAAELLGRLHTGFRALSPTVQLASAPVSNDLAPDVFDEWLARTARAVAAAPRTDQALSAEIACQEAIAIAHRARDVPRTVGVRQLVHGDYGHENVRFTGTIPTAIVDFDFLHFGERIMDLADLAFSPHWMSEFGQIALPPDQRDWDVVATLIGCYDAGSDRPLSHGEISVLPLAMASVPLNWLAASWLQDDPVAAVCLIAPELTTAAWLIEHHQELAALWASRSE